MFKIAVACEKNLIVKHYSKCLNFDIYTIKDKKIINKENYPAINLKKEEISKTFQENNIKYIICDGIGDLARKIFCDNKIEVIMEASGNCRQAVLNFLNKKLTVSSLCSDLSKKES